MMDLIDFVSFQGPVAPTRLTGPVLEGPAGACAAVQRLLAAA